MPPAASQHRNARKRQRHKARKLGDAPSQNVSALEAARRLLQERLASDAGGPAEDARPVAVDARDVDEDMRRALVRFGAAEEEAKDAEEPVPKKPARPTIGRVMSDDEDEDDEGEGEGEDGKVKAAAVAASRKERKALRQGDIARLKQIAPKPDIVEAWDVTASDPLTLVHLKAVKNSVPVPPHWSGKRKYLHGKRGLEKPPFQLPAYIQATGIEKLRAVLTETDEGDAETLRKRTRDRMAPKVGKLDLDYQVLHDAFFRYQTRVQNLTRMGDVYYEGKEFEQEAWTHANAGDDTNAEEAAAGRPRPGKLSFALRAALGMPVPEGHERSVAPAPGSVPWWEKVPPPFLRMMQRYGPPPAYPALRIPGVNAPLPPGCEYGTADGQWGMPPVDAAGAPLYGDVFGAPEVSAVASRDPADTLTPAEKDFRWGALETVDEVPGDDDEEEMEGDEEGEGEGALDDAEAPADGIVTPGGTFVPSVAEADLRAGSASALPGGSATPGFDLRKDAPTPVGAEGDGPPALYTVLETRAATTAAAGSGPLLGTEHTYVIPPSGTGGAVEVALRPEEVAAALENGAEGAKLLGDRYEAGRAAAAAAGTTRASKRKPAAAAEAKPEPAKKKARGGGGDDDFKF